MSLLDDEDTFLGPERDFQIVSSFIHDNYAISHNRFSFVNNRRKKVNNKDEYYEGSVRMWIEDGMVNISVDGNVHLKNQSVKSLTNGLFRFAFVSGTFDCYGCRNLKNLKGLPLFINGDLNCDRCDQLEIDESIHSRIFRVFDYDIIRGINGRNIKWYHFAKAPDRYFYESYKYLMNIIS